MADTRSHLLALPPELRNRVWSLVLATYLFQPSSDSGPPSILQTNHQIRGETLPMYYGDTTFELETGDFSKCNCNWLRSIGDQAAKQIRHVRLCDPGARDNTPFNPWVMQVSLDKVKVEEMLVWETLERETVDYWDAEAQALFKGITDRAAADVKALLAKELESILETREGEGLTSDDWRALIGVSAMRCRHSWLEKHGAYGARLRDWENSGHRFPIQKIKGVVGVTRDASAISLRMFHSGCFPLLPVICM
ncbi:hypothetical protein LTR10_002246 [Elasticomyces elasticus]|nr:hypothetical protein LTR10_002246 [Elasticomyces elasticus]KAK4973681.1 hypothetical protein LTR42_005670 [Elasticomyces elasticus]